MQRIALTQGFFAEVDDEDFYALNLFKWRAFVRRRSDGSIRVVYAVRNLPRVKGQPRPVEYMHAALAKTPAGLFTDHVDGNGLNNCKSNLRAVTNRQNQRNQTNKAIGCSSRFRGVCLLKNTGRWVAHIMVTGKHLCLGTFECEYEAAAAYDVAGIARDPEHFTPNFSASWLAPVAKASNLTAPQSVSGCTACPVR